MKYISVTPRRVVGFSLIEMAVVLVIIGLLIGGLLAPLTTQLDQQRTTETRNQMEEVKRALIGFAIANGRLPCPDPIDPLVGASGVEDPVGGGPCTSPHGFVPAVTLGLNNSGGFVLDGWSNRIRYSVTNANANAFTTAPKFNNVSISTLTTTLTNSPPPGLQVCSSGIGITATPTCAVGAELTRTAVAVIYSLGKNGAATPTSIDEIENTDNNDRFFVSHTPTPAGYNPALGGEFDDQVTWLSYSILFGQMVAAGQLP